MKVLEELESWLRVIERSIYNEFSKDEIIKMLNDIKKAYEEEQNEI